MLWKFYQHFGDRQILAEHFPAMKRFVDYLGTQAAGCILPKYWIGDWGTTVKGWKEGEPALVGTAFYYYDVLIVARTAEVLGKLSEAKRYAALAKQIKQAFNRAFYRPHTGDYEPGTQFANALPLFLRMEPEGATDGLLRNIFQDLDRHDGHFTVGVLGAKYLVDALTQAERPDVVYRLVNQTGFPSWAHLLEGGRTTLSEFWDLHGSHNHVMLGSVDAWFYRSLAGIEPDERHPGFTHFYVRPFVPDGLNWVRASTRSRLGRIAVEWRRSGATLDLKVLAPPGSTATVVLPKNYLPSVANIPDVKASKNRSGEVQYEIGPGAHQFQAEFK